jgi:hypothetical protein
VSSQGYFQPTVGFSADLVLVAAIEDDIDEIDFALNANNDGGILNLLVFFAFH